jgi:UDP-glucose 4-epimerase
MKILVTGVAGFIGSSIAERLLREDHLTVIGVDSFADYYSRSLKISNLERLESSSFEFVEGDLCTIDLSHLIGGVTHVFHEAGQPGVRSSWGDEFSEYTRNNISATQRLLEACRYSEDLQRFLYASSSSVYGAAERFPTQETDLPQPRSPYGVTKLAAEHLCSLYAENFGVPTTSLRYFTVYGPRQRPDMAFTRFCKAALAGDPLTIYGNGEQIREFTFIDDIVEANMVAMTADLRPGTVMNLSGGSSVSVNAVLSALESILGQKVERDYKRPVDGDVFQTGGSFDRARTNLGWAPTMRLREGLERQLAWVQESKG